MKISWRQVLIICGLGGFCMANHPQACAETVETTPIVETGKCNFEDPAACSKYGNLPSCTAAGVISNDFDWGLCGPEGACYRDLDCRDGGATGFWEEAVAQCEANHGDGCVPDVECVTDLSVKYQYYNGSANYYYHFGSCFLYQCTCNP